VLWLFCWTEIGAEYVGIIQSLISTCRMHDVNPYDYLVDVLQGVDRHPASKIRELTPGVRKGKFADQRTLTARAAIPYYPFSAASTIVAQCQTRATVGRA